LVHDPAQADPEKLAQLEAVQRWFKDDWRRIEPKLRTSIVEGISVFLSLFDDNSKVKRVFCPKKECYDPQKNANNQFGKPLARFTSCVLQSGVELPFRAIKTNIADSLNVVIHVERRPGRRYISEVLLINRYDPDADLFDYGAVFLAKQDKS
jgi:hypothetical protein